MVEADLDDRASLERAFAGAHGAFCVTNFWETLLAREGEGSRPGTWPRRPRPPVSSTSSGPPWRTPGEWVPLDDDRMPTLMENYKVPHFDGKGEADAIFEEVGVPTTNLLTSFYWDNLIHFGMGPQRGEDGTLVFNLPDGREEAACHRCGGHRALSLRHLQGWIPSTSERPWGSPGST